MVQQHNRLVDEEEQQPQHVRVEQWHVLTSACPWQQAYR